MPALLNLDEYLDALTTAGTRLADAAATTNLDAPVPTCPSWDVRALVAHQAMVHRWATAHITGTDPAQVPNQTTIRTYDDLLGFYLEGHAKLLDALRAAPDDLRAMTFLNDAPSPRMFWARRQAHETTIHAVDAVAASRERLPSAAVVTVPARVATDGIDELLRGFYTRGSCKLYDGHDETVVIAATDAGRCWVLHVGSTLSVSDDVERRDAVATVAGTAAEIYLALWNRGDEITLRGDDRFLQRWREVQRVQWR